MSQENDFRIIIIDDNTTIHQNFIKILTAKEVPPALDILEREILGNSEKAENFIFPTFQIDTASQGEQGIERIKTGLANGKPYALAFVALPLSAGRNGIETIKHIWKLDPNIQVVIYTAASNSSWEATIKQLGIRDNLLILKKPFDTVSIQLIVSALTRKWQLMQETKVCSDSLEESIQERLRSLHTALSLIRATLESSADGILVINNDGKIIDYNKQFVDMWKIPQLMVESKNFELLLNYMINQLKSGHGFEDMIKEANDKDDKIINGLYKFKDKRIFECYTQPQKLDDHIIGRVWSFRDVTKRISLEEKLQKQATHDALTGLPNRILLRDRIQQAILRAERTGSNFGILFFDLDHFKLVNDSLSHQAGDKLLKKISKHLLSAFRAKDTVARLGGDEFILLIEDLDKNKSMVSIVRKLKNIFKEPYKIAKRDIYVTASMGVSLYPQDGKTVNQLLRNADLAMYRSKELGSDQFHFYKRGMNKLASVRLKQEIELMRAIENEEFFLTYQPQFDLISRKMVSIEALIRWEHPQKATVLPKDFIPLAEETGFIVPIGDWVLRTACQQNKDWQNMGLPAMRISVNVASSQLKQPDFVEKIKSILRETGLKAKYLEIEVTENVITANPEVVEVIKNVRKIGVEISLDDFGTGNSSLGYLKKVQFDRLKIDKSFVNSIDFNRENQVIMQAIIDMAQSLNYQVLAEGVENKKQLAFLINKNCQIAQGYYLAKPMTAPELETLLKEKGTEAPVLEK